jgi:transposase
MLLDQPSRSLLRPAMRRAAHQLLDDAGYDAQQTHEAAAANYPLRLEIVRRSPDAVGFEVIKRRWVVERTFSWFGRNRRLAKDYENLANTLLAFVTLAAIQFGIRRLARK